MTATIAAACCAVLETADFRAKIFAARRLRRDWQAGRLAWMYDVVMPDRPARGPSPILLAPGKMPKRGRGGSATGRIALLHALAHIEYTAIDLAIDLVGRFGAHFPRGFVDEWLEVAAEEAMHFALLNRRLYKLGAAYGDLPAHDGLWEAAGKTATDPIARLAIVPLVLEARGLDVTPQMIARFEANGDAASARLLGRIYEDEIDHVATGMRWFAHACEADRVDPVTTWIARVDRHFRDGLKPPFNDSARARAGLTPDYYAAVAPAAPSGQTSPRR